MSNKRKNKRNSQEIPQLILFTAKLFERISPNLATSFASKLFITPIKHRIPKREFKMERESCQEKVLIPELNKSVHVYHFGKSDKKVLLVHGWSGRGTQMSVIAESLLEKGYATVSFDAPAHGKSAGSTTIMTEFISSIHELNKLYGPFEFAVGHSLGAMAITNAIKEGLPLKKAVLIGSGDVVTDIIDEFIAKLQLKADIGRRMQQRFEKKFGLPMNNYSASEAAKKVDIPVLIVHDEHDDDVPVKAGINIHKHLKNSELIITQGLGHRKILGDEKVVEQCLMFLEKE
jgi:pimeloyl-ACP methyl ester carboxylesterase